MSTAETGLGTDRARTVASFLSEWLREDNLPGASVGIVENDSLVYANGFGSRDLDSNAPATERTLYGVGSVSKSFTALAIMQLAETGQLDVTDPIDEFLDVELGSEPPITIHDLLTHSSGLPSLGVSTVLLNRKASIRELGVPMGGLDDFLTHVRNAAGELAAPPGERFFYCNAGYSLLGLIIETVSGRSFDRYVTEEIFEPLGMRRSLFRQSAFERVDDRMTPYQLTDEGPEPTSLPVRELSFPAGGVVTSVSELSRYLRAQMANGCFDGMRVADAEAFDRMHEPHVETDSGSYGYGWRRSSVGDRSIIGHSGSIAVASAYAGFTADREWGVVLGCNASPSYPLSVIAKGVFAILDGMEPTDVVPFFRRRRAIEELTGTYESYRGILTVRVVERGGILELTYEGGADREPQALVPTGDSFRTYEFAAPAAAGHRRTVEFDAEGDGIDLYIDRWRLHKTD
ncbi:MAG: serine hydrolase [Halobacteriales archaeon]|nr:serine hydrolase [Halobacteriales archaeon]